MEYQNKQKIKELKNNLDEDYLSLEDKITILEFLKIQYIGEIQ